MLMFRSFLQTLTGQDVLVLREGPAMDLAMRKLLPMGERSFDDRQGRRSAQERAATLLNRLQAQGLYC